MDVKFDPGARPPEPAHRAAPPQKPAAAPFAELLHVSPTAQESAAAPDGENFSAQTPEEVFAHALSNRADPDLDRLDAYLEWMIGREQKK